MVTRELLTIFDGLASKFAIYAADFIRKFEAQGGGTICVRDAYREPGEQQCAANNSANGNAVAKPGHSKHEIGEAVDLNPRGGATYTTMRSFADQNEKCTWFRYQCNQDTSPGNSTKDSLNDCPHLELKSSCDAGTLPTANANPSRYTSSPSR